MSVARQVAVPIYYEGVSLESGLRLDLLVQERVIVEVKAVEKMNPVFEAQLLTYLKLSGKRLGFLINFTVLLLKLKRSRTASNAWSSRVTDRCVAR